MESTTATASPYPYASAGGQENATRAINADAAGAAIQIIRTFLLGAIFLMGSACCVLALTTCYRRRRELKSTASIFVVNLCIGDLLICLFAAPVVLMDTVWMRGEYVDEKWCRIEGALTVALFAASALNACAVSVDRYVAVNQSLRYASWFSKATRNGIIAASWTVSACIGAAPLLSGAHGGAHRTADYFSCVFAPLPPATYGGVAYATCLAGAAYVVPLGVHVFVYVSIYRATKNTTALARRNSVQTPRVGAASQSLSAEPRSGPSGIYQHQNQNTLPYDHLKQQQPPPPPLQDHAADSEAPHGGRKVNVRRPSWQMRLVHKDDRKAARMGLIVVFSFVVSWSALYFLMLAESLGVLAAAQYGWLPVWLALGDCVVNPLVYVLRSKRSLDELKCKTRIFRRQLPSNPRCFSINRVPNNSSKRLIEASDEYSGAEIYA